MAIIDEYKWQRLLILPFQAIHNEYSSFGDVS
jgi:hypothetical protein